MDNKEVFQTWAPQEGFVWTKFAKPALFAHMEKQKRGRQVYSANIPMDIRELDTRSTALIVDLPGSFGVEVGLGLANNGFRPIPLYNGIHEAQNGDLSPAVDNTAIINALHTGADKLRYAALQAQAPPAFLLDSNRDTNPAFSGALYDNRWNVDIDDMPDPLYLEEQGISRVVVWTEHGIQDDLRTIIRSYQDFGIDLVTYIDGNLEHRVFTSVRTNEPKMLAEPKMPAFPKETTEAVRHFENGRFALLVVVILASINLIGMFLVNEEPFLWTAPTIMWLTYLWVSEIIGDVIAIALTLIYWLLYWQSHKKRGLLQAAALLFGIEVIVLFVYAISYGLAAYTEDSFYYGLIVFVTPVVLLVLLVRGAAAYKTVRKISEIDYEATLDDIDGLGQDNRTSTHLAPRRRVLRSYRGANYRGYGGYGGTGRGGYGGGGSGSFSG